MADADRRARPVTHILAELGFELTRVGDELHGSAVIGPEMFVSGTTSLRTSVLATWADTAAGHAVMKGFLPRVPVTLDLDVYLYQPIRGRRAVTAVARLIKAGQSVSVVEVMFTDHDGEPLAFSTSSFMAAPNPAVVMPAGSMNLGGRQTGRLTVPLAERAGCEIREPGVAVQPWTEDGLNASGTLSGGLIALAIEEAALSATPGATLSYLATRFLRPVRVGPAVASAEVRHGQGRVEVRDAGDGDRLAVFATTRIFDAA